MKYILGEEWEVLIICVISVLFDKLLIREMRFNEFKVVLLFVFVVYLWVCIVELVVVKVLFLFRFKNGFFCFNLIFR